MPKRCGAYLLAADHPTYERLAATVLALGFEHCLPFVSAREVARGRDFPLNYLFVHDGVDLATMAATFVDVRWYEDKDIRFMPVVLLAEHTTRAESRELWKLGYDVMLNDLGETQDNAAQLMLQITEPQHYYETEDYFGPNRRISRDPDQDVAASFCRHMLIRRSPVYGVRVASSEVLERAQLYAY